MDLWVREARSVQIRLWARAPTSRHLRGCQGEALSGGGKSSGLMGFLKIGDRAAGAIKSGGTTRRAAKMVIVRCMDHPDIEEFVELEGDRGAESGVHRRRLQDAREDQLNAIFRSAIRDVGRSRKRTPLTRPKNPALKDAIRRSQAGRDPRDLRQARARLRQVKATAAIEFPTYDTDWDS